MLKRYSERDDIQVTVVDDENKKDNVAEQNMLQHINFKNTSMRWESEGPSFSRLFSSI